MKFEDLTKQPEYKSMKEIRTVGEAIDVKAIVASSFKKKSEEKEKRLKEFLKKNDIDYSKVKNDQALRSEFMKVFDLLDKKEEEEIVQLRQEKDALQKQLDISQAIKDGKKNLAQKIADKAGIKDEDEIKKIAASLADISKKYEKSQDLG